MYICSQAQVCLKSALSFWITIVSSTVVFYFISFNYLLSITKERPVEKDYGSSVLCLKLQLTLMVIKSVHYSLLFILGVLLYKSKK